MNTPVVRFEGGADLLHLCPLAGIVIDRNKIPTPTIPRHRIDFRFAAEVGRRIYEEKYHSALEPRENGKFLASDLESGIAELGDTPTHAMDAGKKAAPGGWFYIMRVGYPTTYVLHQAEESWVDPRDVSCRAAP